MNTVSPNGDATGRGPDLPDDLLAALKVVVSEGTLDVHVVREREAKGWHGPRVVALAEAEGVLRRYAGPVSAQDVEW